MNKMIKHLEGKEPPIPYNAPLPCVLPLICERPKPIVIVVKLSKLSIALLRIPNGKHIWFWYETAPAADAS